MSMHNKPLTPTEEAGLRAHGLPIGEPSQLADTFRAGMAYADRAKREPARDWVEDFPHENGNYECECVHCGNRFMGHKRRCVCKACAALPVQQARVPDFWAVVEPSGFVSYTAPHPEACHEHINDAINEFGINEAAQWQVRSAYFDAAPTPPAPQEQARVPDGWKPVPIDPTDAMTFIGQSMRHERVNSIGAIYDAMLAAAPAPPGEAE